MRLWMVVGYRFAGQLIAILVVTASPGFAQQTNKAELRKILKLPRVTIAFQMEYSQNEVFGQLFTAADWIRTTA